MELARDVLHNVCEEAEIQLMAGQANNGKWSV